MAKKHRPAHRSHKASFDPEKSRWFVPIAFVVLLLALVFLFSEFIFSDQMLFSSDPLNASIMFRIYQTQYMAENGLSIPQWLPHQFGGMPFVEAFHSDIFYPPSLAIKCLQIWFYEKVEAIDVARALGWLFLIHIFLSGIFMYRAARQFKLARVPSLMAGASYMLAGYLVSMVAPGHDGKIFVAALFPAMMFFLDRGFEKKALWGQIKYFSLTGLTIGLILLTPHPQMSYFALWGLSFFAAFRLILMWVKRQSIIPAVKPGLLVVYAVAIGLLLSAIQMYPGVKYTSEYSPRADTKKGWDWATSWSMHEEEAASMIIPEFSGTSAQDVRTYYWGKNAFKDNSEWVGTVPLFVALLGLFYYRRRKEAWFFGGLGLFALLYGLGGTTPFFWILFNLVPKVDSMRAPSMIMFLCSFSVAMLAGMGLQSVLDIRAEGKKALNSRYDYVLLGFPTFLFLLAAGFSLVGRGLMTLWCSIFYSEAATTMVQERVSKLDVAHLNLPAIQSGAWLAFLFVGLAAFCVWLYRHGKAGDWVLVILLAVPVIDGVRFNNRFFSLVDKARFSYQYESNGLTDYLAALEEKFRVFNLGVPKEANLPVHGVDVTVGYHGNQLRWYDDLLGGPALTYIYQLKPRLFNLTGTKYLINPTQNTIPTGHFGERPLTQIATYGNTKLLRNDNAFPRLYLADQYKVITDRDLMVNEVLNGSTDLQSMVLLEEEPSMVIETDSASADSAWIIDYQAEKVTVGVEAAQDRILVLTDAWFPSWQVTIDDQPAKLLRAYGAFRAVEVPAGSRQIRFEYHSDRYALGRTVTLATAFYLLGIIGFSWLWDRRRPIEETVNEEMEPS